MNASRAGSILAALALCAGCWAAQSGDGADPTPPLPRSAPLAPGNDVTVVPEGERVLQALEQAARERDERIQAILRISGGSRPVATSDLGPGLERPRAERDTALADLRTALDEYLGRTHRVEADVLDPHGASRQERQLQPLSAENRIAVAECLRELAIQTQGPDHEARLAEGLKELEALPSEVPDEQRPRAAYLKVWFLSEASRAATDPAVAADRGIRAHAAAADLATNFPRSELVSTAEALVADLPAAKP